ncbi:MAG: CHAT domain-containing protein [Symplocastrum torsivum CPER-KK1]|jgi:hypothetical protein|uniref:CHAT domain-containing protein n=1 Tax=Symplocastrum torsivum CPER-KK1 TaxID=450513 RepID=A0A951UAI3_9CYAN|nr:CHAT domain-containing protein [Symplocastrum torsivum CPER-KK1]
MELFELYLSPIDATRFKVIITQSPAGEGEVESALPFCDGSQDWRITLIKTLESASFRSESFAGEGEKEWMVKAEILAADRTTFHFDYQARIGKALYQALFPSGSKVERALHSSLRQAEEKNTQLLVQLKLEADAVQRSRLSDYPWELLHDGQRFLLHHQLGFSRYIAHDTAPPSLSPSEQVNVLLVSSAAFDSQMGLKRLSKQEQQAIGKGLDKASDAEHICLRELEYPTFNELRTYLTENRGKEAPHIVHFDGHGLYGKRCQQCGAMHKGIKVERCKKEACLAPLPEPQGYLVFEDEEGEADYISARELGTLLHQIRLSDGTHQTGGVALVVLSACQSGMAVDGESVFNGTAQNLIGHCVPAVVAMQYSVSVEAATSFAEQFYRSLGQKDSLSIAVNQGREAMGTDGNQWYRPVLYLRWRDNEGGQLFSASRSPFPIGILSQHNSQTQISNFTVQQSFKTAAYSYEKGFTLPSYGATKQVALKKIFIQYINPEILSLYGVLQNISNSKICEQALRITKYALLFSDDIIIMPASYLFESPFIYKFLEKLQPLIADGILHFASPTSSWQEYLDTKLIEYRDELSLYSNSQNRKVAAGIKKLNPQWIPRIQRSSAQDISSAWKKELYKDTGIWKKILDKTIQKHGSIPQKLDLAIDNVPERLDGKAFIYKYAVSLLPVTFEASENTQIGMLISRSYLESYLEEFDAIMFTNTPLGQLDCGLQQFSTEGKLRTISLRALFSFLKSIRIQQYIDNSLEWEELIELRENFKFRWLKKQILENTLCPNHPLERVIIKSNYRLDDRPLNPDPLQAIDEILEQLIVTLEPFLT